MKYIPLANTDKMAIVSDCDYKRVMKHSWYLGKRQGYPTTAISYDPKTQKSGLCCLHNFIVKAPKGFRVDHRNRNKLDNQRRNLRFATSQQQTRNQSLRKNKKTSKYKGVYLAYAKAPYVRPNPWFARINIGTRILGGYFKTQLEAALQYDRWARKYFGKFACTNKMLGLL